MALVICLSLCACGGGNETLEQGEAPIETEPTYLQIGDTASTDIAETVLIGVSYKDSYKEIIPKAGYSFIVIDFSLKNIGKTDFGFFPAMNGSNSKMPCALVAVDYNDGYTFIVDDVEGENGQNYGISFFDDSTLTSDLKPLSDAVTFQTAICVPNEVVENTAAPLLIKINLLNSQGETEVATFSLR